MAREKGENEVFCRSCGEPIKVSAEFCPHCGVENAAFEPDTQGVAETGTDEKTALDKYGPIIAWIGGALFILAGLGSFVSIVESPGRALMGGLLYVATGLFVLPPVREQLSEQFDDSPVWLSRAAVVVIALVGLVVAGAAAPVSDTSTDISEPETGGEAQNLNQQDQSGSDSGSNDASSSDDGSDGISSSSGPDYAIRVSYSGAWQGALSVTGGGESESRSISGSGTETISIMGDVDIISANAQKQDASNAELTIQILKNGEVVSESSTTAEYGLAQTSKSFF